MQLIRRFLKAGVVSEGQRLETPAGTPQGSVLSPVGNIYLHYVLDLWFERVIQPRLDGYAQLVRYADDFVVGFQHKSDAQAFSTALRMRLAKFGLKLASPSRTQWKLYKVSRNGRIRVIGGREEPCSLAEKP